MRCYLPSTETTRRADSIVAAAKKYGATEVIIGDAIVKFAPVEAATADSEADA